MDKKTLIIACLCLVSFTAFGGEVDSLALLQSQVDSLTTKVTTLENNTQPLVDWWNRILWLFGIAILVLGYFGFSIKWNLKTTVLELVKKEANKLVAEEFAKQIQAKPEVVNSFFQDLQRKEDIKTQKRFLVVSKSEGKQSWLNSIFERKGYDTKNFEYRSFEESKNIDTNNFDFVLFNNSVKVEEDRNKGKQESKPKITAELQAILDLMDLFNGKLEKQFYLGEHIPNEYMEKCKNIGVSFTTMPAYLADNILSNS